MLHDTSPPVLRSRDARGPHYALDRNSLQTTEKLTSKKNLFAGAYLDSLLKVLIDRLLGGLLLLFFLPVIVVFGFLVCLTSRGPAFYTQKRYGRYGEVFSIYKLRSMRLDVSDTFHQAVKGDQRITRVGQVIRKASIDELPQLLNVVRGEMSLVGPRPHPIALDDRYEPIIDNYHRRFLAAPGMTGLAQVSGARGETPTVEHMRRRIELDLKYVQQASFWVDLKILALTAREVFFSPARNDVF